MAFVNCATMLRKRAIDTERILWRHLRNRNFAGYKVSPSAPIWLLRARFLFPNGKARDYRPGQIRDRKRSNVVADRGIMVLRFWNHQVRRELYSVLRAIWFALEERPLSQPSPQSPPLGRDRPIASDSSAFEELHRKSAESKASDDFRSVLLTGN